jgi:hypothetical protein
LEAIHIQIMIDTYGSKSVSVSVCVCVCV